MYSLSKRVICLLGLCCSLNALAARQPGQSIASIQGAIDRFIDSEFKETENFEYHLARLDPRLQLPQCEQALTVFSQTGGLKAGFNSLGIHCKSGKKWTIFTVAQIKAFKPVVVLAQPLRRGELVEQRHLRVKTQDIADLRQGYLSDPSQAIGKQAKRNLATGTVLNGSLLTERKLVKRGERVTISARSPHFEISMAGEALMDGSKGQHIRIRNLGSKRVIEATVVEQGQVSVD